MSTDFTNPGLSLDPLHFPVPKYPVYRFSVDEYLKMVDTGALDFSDVELLEGVVTPKMTRNPWHDGILGVVEEILEPMLPKGWTTRVQMSFVGPDSVPEPDLAVVRGSRRVWVKRRPTAADTTLVVEVAESSIAIDREKAGIYATAGVPNYWIVNGKQQCIEVHRQPVSTPDGKAKYSIIEVHRNDQPLSVILAGIAVGTITCNQVLEDVPESELTDPT